MSLGESVVGREDGGKDGSKEAGYVQCVGS